MQSVCIVRTHDAATPTRHAQGRELLTGESKMQMKITVRKDKNYGQEVIYPVCDRAKIFAEMLKTKTLTQSSLEYIRDLGFYIEVIPYGWSSVN